MGNKTKILLPNKRGVTSEDVDMFLNIDLNQTFCELKKERYDNDFDLSAQFTKERNQSRNFIIYGEIDSTAVNCDNLSIKVYSDSGHTDSIAVIHSSSISYNRPNVFGKKKGKYYIKINNYKHDSVYFKIDSNHFSYKDQNWDQRLVFYDADLNFVPYGTETVDVNSDGTIAITNNAFPFFFNKHWVRNDYSMIEEKNAKVSFDVSSQTFSEGQSGQVLISLDKPSPFGLEIVKLSCLDTSSSGNFILGSSVPVGGTVMSNSSGQISFATIIPSDKTQLVATGSALLILNGSYAGEHTIAASEPTSVDGQAGFYAITLSSDYDPSGTNSINFDFRAGTLPDVDFELDGTPIVMPIDMFWAVDQRVKALKFTARTDFEIEFTEQIDLELGSLTKCDAGRIMKSRLVFQDSTPRHYVSLFLGQTHENRAAFTGRTYNINETTISTVTIQSPSILRNGYRFEGRNEEFYPNDFYDIKITNSGGKTVFPINPQIGVNEESIFEPGETRTFRMWTKYDDQQRHQIKLFLSDSAMVIGVSAYIINGVRVYGPFNYYNEYEYFKSITDDGSSDFYRAYNLIKPFDAQFNEAERSVVLTSRSPGVRLDVSSIHGSITAVTLNNFFEKSQIEQSIKLLANSFQNTKATYSF